MTLWDPDPSNPILLPSPKAQLFSKNSDALLKVLLFKRDREIEFSPLGLGPSGCFEK